MERNKDMLLSGNSIERLTVSHLMDTLTPDHTIMQFSERGVSMDKKSREDFRQGQ